MTPAEPAALLAAYLDSGREESAFVALVERLGGLVLASALRRTGNRLLAEEVAQNVFSILARKAGSLRSHPNFSAWVFRTTQLESVKAMRSERRHQKKIAVFAAEPGSVREPAESDALWEEALPALDAALDDLPEKDRALLIQRYFEKKRFAELARISGKSEAATKMQLKRVLEKLSTLLRARGVALLATAVASGLATEFAKAAPMAASGLAAKALAVSGGVSTTTILSNTILTMGSAKTTAITAASLVAISLIPIVGMENKVSDLRSEISRLESNASRSATDVSTPFSPS